MTTFCEARQLVLDRTRPLAPAHVPLLEAVGRVLAVDVAAPADFPSFDTSAMDGWALRATDAARPTSLPVVAFVPAGTVGEPLAAGAAARIMTGAPVPDGADSVVPLEEAEERAGVLHLDRLVRPGAHVRRRGADMASGEVVLRAGTVIGGAQVSFLASAQRAEVPVFQRPRVAIVSTGDELVALGAVVGPGRIIDANGPAVAAAVLEAGGVPVPLGIVPDDPAALRARLKEGLEADVLVTTAGVSVGDRDHVREVLAELGVDSVFFTLDVKPGHPTAFGVGGRTLVFSLPGNPVSTLTMFEQLVRPALLRMQGHREVLRHLVTAVLEESLPHRAGRVTFSRVRLGRREGVLTARSAGSQETGMLRPLLEAEGIAMLPADRCDAPAGLAVQVLALRAPPPPA